MHPTHRIFEAIPPAVEPEGPRPRLRWKDGVSEDARKIGAAGARDRKGWRTRLEKVVALLMMMMTQHLLN